MATIDALVLMNEIEYMPHMFSKQAGIVISFIYVTLFEEKMKYLFSTILGSFVLDQNVEMIDSVLFKEVEEYSHKGDTEAKLHQKYPDLKSLPLEKLPLMLLQVKNKKYFSLFYKQNMEWTKKAIREAVSEDNFIMQAIANINELDKVSNTLSKRLREWYAFYAPEVVEKIRDHAHFAELISTKTKKELFQELKINPADSMGAEMDKAHVEEMILLANEIKKVYELRLQHEKYLHFVMEKYCPNLAELAGVTIGAKLLELGRGLKAVALLPASTIQLLGAEKALFRHIKTGARSPKYGIIINHPLIQNAPKTSKGKAARMLADKLSLCARLDYFKGEFKAKEYRKELEEKLAK